MAKKKEPVQPCSIKVDNRTFDWGAVLNKARESHWRRVEVTIKLRERLLAGKPASLDAANAMLAARGLSDHIQAVSDIEDPDERAQAAERVAKLEGLCEFTRRPGKPGLWFPANNLKAGIKENWSVLGLAVSVRGSRKALAEGIFVYCADSWEKPTEERDWIYVGPDSPPPKVQETPVHSVGPQGPVHSIKRNEYVEGVTIKFDVYIAQFSSIQDKITNEDIAKVMIHFSEHGLGASRSQGHGKFDVLGIRELNATATVPESETVPAMIEAA